MLGSLNDSFRSLWHQQFRGGIVRKGSRRSSTRFTRGSGRHRRRQVLEILEDRRLLAAVPSFTINDVQQLEGDDATSSFVFTVTRSGKTNQTSIVDYATADSLSSNAATAGVDYESKSGTLEFAPGEKTKTIAVTVNGDLDSETDEQFFVNLSNATGATLSDSQGLGTIEDDDSASVQNTIYVRSLEYETRQRGKQTEIRFIVDVRIDSDNDGISEDSDARAAGAVVVVSLYNSPVTKLNGDSNIRNFVGTLSEGVGSTYWYKLPGPGEYHVEVHDVSLAGCSWDPSNTLELGLDDEDQDGRPDLVIHIF